VLADALPWAKLRFMPSHPSRNRGPAPAGRAAPLLVLDTNVVLDWVAFGDARVQSIVAAIESRFLRAATSAACLEELRRALAYPEVKLDAAAQALALERYLAHAVLFESPASGVPAKLPLCEDPDDQKFLELAWHSGASHLLTRDRALLKLARRVAALGRFSVLAPQEFEPPRE
jgi:putative PIN family toxin of toxin-antitoxin system